jgi:hypothetical protein
MRILAILALLAYATVANACDIPRARAICAPIYSQPVFSAPVYEAPVCAPVFAAPVCAPVYSAPVYAAQMYAQRSFYAQSFNVGYQRSFIQRNFSTGYASAAFAPPVVNVNVFNQQRSRGLLGGLFGGREVVRERSTFRSRTIIR